MENISLRLFFIVGILLFFVLIVLLLRRKSLDIKYTLVWFLTASIMLILTIFPGLIIPVGHMLGFEVFSNAIFSLLFGFVITIILSLTTIVSKQSRMIKTLVQTNALLEKRLRTLEEKS